MRRHNTLPDDEFDYYPEEKPPPRQPQWLGIVALVALLVILVFVLHDSAVKLGLVK
jgi:hypothetical protein